MTLPSLQIAVQGLLGQVSPTLLNIAMQGLIGVSSAVVTPPRESGYSGYYRHWYVKHAESERRKNQKKVRSFQDMLADAAQARAAKAAIPQRVSAPIIAAAVEDVVERIPEIVQRTYAEVLRDEPRLPAPVYKIYSSHYSNRPIIPLNFRKAVPVIPEKIRKQRVAMNTIVLALSILED